MKTTQPEVVEPRWVKVAKTTLAQHRNLSQEKRPWDGREHLGGFVFTGDMSVLEYDLLTKKLFEPMSQEEYDMWKDYGAIAGSTCRYCPYPITDGYDRIFPERCNDCNTLNSYRARGRVCSRKLVAIKTSLNLESILWTFTFPLVHSNRPLNEDEIITIAKERRIYISQNLFRDKKIWHDQFVGINVMECVVTEPGETRKARWMDDEYEREASNMWTYHIHGHYLILNHKKSKVNLELAYAKFGSEQDGMPPKMRLNYKHERDYDRRKLNSRGEQIGERDEMKIMRDYLVGYARKDCLGKLAWVGDKNWRKVRTWPDKMWGQPLDEKNRELFYKE